jgi:hypothetical protein
MEPQPGPHRGALVLVLGVLGWVLCPIFSIFAVVIGKSDLDRMRRGELDRSGETATLGGAILGGVNLAIYGLVVLAVALIAGFAVLVALLRQIS